MKHPLIKLVEDQIATDAKAIREKAKGVPEVPPFQVGDTVDVHLRILEGEKESTLDL